MRLTVDKGELLVMLGRELSLGDAERFGDAVRAFGHLSRVTLDFSEALDFQYASLAALGRTLAGMRDARIRVRGLTLHQTCILQECVDGPALGVAVPRA